MQMPVWLQESVKDLMYEEKRKNPDLDATQLVQAMYVYLEGVLEEQDEPLLTGWAYDIMEGAK